MTAPFHPQGPAMRAIRRRMAAPQRARQPWYDHTVRVSVPTALSLFGMAVGWTLHPTGALGGLVDGVIITGSALGVWRAVRR